MLKKISKVSRIRYYESPLWIIQRLCVFIQITFDVKGDILTERHIRSDDPADKGEIYFYTIESDKLVLVSTFSCCPLSMQE